MKLDDPLLMRFVKLSSEFLETRAESRALEARVVEVAKSIVAASGYTIAIGASDEDHVRVAGCVVRQVMREACRTAGA